MKTDELVSSLSTMVKTILVEKDDSILRSFYPRYPTISGLSPTISWLLTGTARRYTSAVPLIPLITCPDSWARKVRWPYLHTTYLSMTSCAWSLHRMSKKSSSSPVCKLLQKKNSVKKKCYPVSLVCSLIFFPVSSAHEKWMWCLPVIYCNFPVVMCPGAASRIYLCTTFERLLVNWSTAVVNVSY